MTALVLHDDRGNIKALIIPSDTLVGKRYGVRSHNGHEIADVELADLEPSKLHAHVADLMATHRVEKATGTRPARLVAKPRRQDK